MFSNEFDETCVTVFDPSTTLLSWGIQSLKVCPSLAMSHAGVCTTGT